METINFSTMKRLLSANADAVLIDGKIFSDYRINDDTIVFVRYEKRDDTPTWELTVREDTHIHIENGLIVVKLYDGVEISIGCFQFKELSVNYEFV